MNSHLLKALSFILIVLMTTSCSKRYAEDDLITSHRDQEKYLVGKWEINGTIEIERDAKVLYEGQIEFRKLRRFESIIAMSMEVRERKIFTSACTGKGFWRWTNLGIGMVNEELENSCDCTYEILDRSIDREQLTEMIEGMWPCKDGKISYGDLMEQSEQSPEANQFRTGDLEFRKNRIDITFRDYAEGGGVEMSLTRKGELK